MDDLVVEAGADAIAKGSQSFAMATRLFDRETRESALLLYHWCRRCDDIVDEQELGTLSARSWIGTPSERLAAFEARTRAVLGGERDTDPVFSGLARVLQRHAIPPRYLMAHLDGFRMDAEGRVYRRLEDTLDYCYHVAGVVGLMMAHVMGVRDPATLDRACDLGLAFQLTNIARDIVPDAGQNRIYLPGDWLDEAGLSGREIASEPHRAALARVAARLIDAAEPYYASALIGVDQLPRRSAWAIRTAHASYRQIGLEVKRRGARAWDERVSIGRSRQLFFVARSGACALLRTASSRPRPAGLWRRPA